MPTAHLDRIAALAREQLPVQRARLHRHVRGPSVAVHSTTVPQYHSITVPQYHSTTVPQYHSTTVSQYHDPVACARRQRQQNLPSPDSPEIAEGSQARLQRASGVLASIGRPNRSAKPPLGGPRFTQRRVFHQGRAFCVCSFCTG